MTRLNVKKIYIYKKVKTSKRDEYFLYALYMVPVYVVLGQQDVFTLVSIVQTTFDMIPRMKTVEINSVILNKLPI